MSGFTLLRADALVRRGFGMLLQAGIPRTRRPREPTADSSFSLIPALSAAVGSRPFRTKKRAPTMALIFRAPAKIAQRVLRDNFRAPAKIAQRVLREEGDAGVKENSLSFLKLFRNAPCGDVVEMFHPNPNLIPR